MSSNCNQTNLPHIDWRQELKVSIGTIPNYHRFDLMCHWWSWNVHIKSIWMLFGSSTNNCLHTPFELRVGTNQTIGTEKVCTRCVRPWNDQSILATSWLLHSRFPYAKSSINLFRIATFKEGVWEHLLVVKQLWVRIATSTSCSTNNRHSFGAKMHNYE